MATIETMNLGRPSATILDKSAANPRTNPTNGMYRYGIPAKTDWLRIVRNQFTAQKLTQR